MRDMGQVEHWLERYSGEVARLACELEEIDESAGLAAQANALWFWAHNSERGDRVAVHGQRVLAGLEEVQGDTGTVVLVAAQGLCAWGLWPGEESRIREADRLVRACWRAWEGDPQHSIGLSFWVSLLELCSHLLYAQPERELHIIASRCVATLLNEYYDVGTKSFMRALDYNADGLLVGEAAPAGLALKAVDAVMNEAVRCGDGRLFDWGDCCARAYASHNSPNSGAIDMLRITALRSLRHRATSWGVGWVDSELNAPDDTPEARALRQRSACLCRVELEQLAKSDGQVSGSLRY